MLSQILKRATFWLALAGFGVLAALVNATTTRAPVPPPLFPAAEKPFARGIGASGLIESMRENTQIGVPLPGLVMEVAVKVRDRVQSGDLLLRLDDREMRAQLITRQTELALREAELSRARRQHGRLSGLNPAAFAREELEKRADEIPVAEAAVAHAQAGIRQTHELLDRCLVRAPISGSILQINTRPGEYLAPGSPNAPLVLGSMDEFQVRVEVDEQLAPRVHANARAVAFRKGAGTDAITLEFVRIEPYIIPKRNLTGDSNERVDTRVLPVIFRLRPAPGLQAYVGQQVDVFIEETEPHTTTSQELR